MEKSQKTSLREFSPLVYLDAFTNALAGFVAKKITGEKTEGWFDCGDDGRWQGWLAPNHWHQHPAWYPSVDRQTRRSEDRRPVSGRPQCNHLRCWNGCNRPFPSLPTTLAPSHTRFTTSPCKILPPARLSGPAVNRDWDPLVGLGLLTRSACDCLHSELIRPPRMLQLQLCVEELWQVRHINHHGWMRIAQWKRTSVSFLLIFAACFRKCWL